MWEAPITEFAQATFLGAILCWTWTQALFFDLGLLTTAARAESSLTRIAVTKFIDSASLIN